MKWIQFRPTFQIDLIDTPEDAISKLGAEYQKLGPGNNFVISGEYGELHLPSSEHRVWSPYLTFYVYERQGVCSVFGRFSPRLQILVFLWFVYMIMACTAFFSLAFASSQWALNQPMWALWIAFAAISMIAVLYVVAHIGQQWSADQMQFLRNRLDELLQSSGIQLRKENRQKESA